MERANRIVGAAAVGAAMLIGLPAPSAQAAYIVDLTQQGSNVVATGSGTIDLTDLAFNQTVVVSAGIIPDEPAISTGPTTPETLIFYTGYTGPTSFGTGLPTSASNGSGDLVDLASDSLGVPLSYVSGSFLLDSSTYNNQTFSTLGVTPGTYKWTWGSGAHADTFTLVIGAAAIPEPSTWAMMLLGFAGVGFATYRRRSPKNGSCLAAA